MPWDEEDDDDDPEWPAPRDKEWDPPTTAFVIVPPKESRFDGAGILAVIEDALAAALPAFQFTVTIDSPKRCEYFVVAPNGMLPDAGLTDKIMFVLIPFIVGEAGKLQ
jgi:hypothetical protein